MPVPYRLQAAAIQKQVDDAEANDEFVQKFRREEEELKIKKIRALENKLKKKISKKARANYKASIRNIKAAALSTERDRAFLALAKIRSHYPKTPEGALMYEVLKVSVYDLFIYRPETRQAAARYLNSEMYTCELCGINCDWIRKELERAHVHVNARLIK